MTNVMDEYAHLQNASIGELNARYQQLKTSAPYDQLSDEALQELVAIARIMRKRTSAPAAKKSATKTAPTLDAL